MLSECSRWYENFSLSLFSPSNFSIDWWCFLFNESTHSGHCFLFSNGTNDLLLANPMLISYLTQAILILLTTYSLFFVSKMKNFLPSVKLNYCTLHMIPSLVLGFCLYRQYKLLHVHDFSFYLSANGCKMHDYLISLFITLNFCVLNHWWGMLLPFYVAI